MDTEIKSEAARAIPGCLLGTAVGDALGLPAEGLSRSRQVGRFGAEIDRYRFLFGRGMVSDDTEHTIMVAQATIASAGDPALFEKEMACQLRRWLLLLPGGVGTATLRATAKLLVGVPPSRSGVWSAGNGPAMRSALLGVCFGHDPERLRTLVRTCTRITHTDPKAERGALAVAVASHLSRQGLQTPSCYVPQLRGHLTDVEDGEFLELVEKAAQSAAAGEETPTFARSIGLTEGVSGYVYHTVPVALQAWMRHPTDLRAAVTGAIACGGDTDSAAAIVGGIVGAGVGKAGIPAEWLSGLAEWPRGVPWLEQMAERLITVIETGKPDRPLRVSVPALAARNVLFVGTVLYHGLRRLLPPY